MVFALARAWFNLAISSVRFFSQFCHEPPIKDATICHRVDVNLREVGQRFNTMDHSPFYQALDMLPKSGMFKSGRPLLCGRHAMRLYLINPSNPLVSIVKVKESRWNRYRVWKPLSLMVLAGLTPPEWEITIVDENLGGPDYSAMPRPDLVGITAFTSQANRAYEVAAHFRHLGVPVVMGGIHATLCLDEVMEHVDSVVTGEAESVWADLLEDTRHGRLQHRYDGGHADMNDLAPARHDLLPARYAFGAIQTTRGCPLNCNFCSVTTFNGAQYRQRPISDVISEFRSILEKRVLVVDDNLIGTRPEHIARAKDLFRALTQAKLHKEWVAQATINFADDEELLALAAKAGCRGVFIGFESPTPEGLRELGKKINLMKGRDFRASVQRIQRHNILVVGSFILGLDIDEAGIGQEIARVASQYRLGQSQHAVSDTFARYAAVGPNEIRRPHCARGFSGRLEILHADLPGGSVQAPLVG